MSFTRKPIKDVKIGSIYIDYICNDRMILILKEDYVVVNATTDYIIARHPTNPRFKIIYICDGRIGGFNLVTTEILKEYYREIETH